MPDLRMSRGLAVPRCSASVWRAAALLRWVLVLLLLAPAFLVTGCDCQDSLDCELQDNGDFRCVENMCPESDDDDSFDFGEKWKES